MELRDSEDYDFISVLPDDRLGGAEYIMYNISRSLYDEKYKTGLVYFLKNSITGAWENVSSSKKTKFAKYHKLWISIIPCAFELRKLTTKKVKYVFSSQTHVNGYLGLLRKLGFLKTDYLIVRESNTVYDRRTGISLAIVKMLHRIGYPQTDLIICQTQYMKDNFVGRIAQAKNWNVQVIPNPLPLSETIEKSNKDIDENWDELSDYLVGAGRLMELKGFDLLIEAFSKLENKKLNLVILGKGEKLQSLKSLAEKFGVFDRVYFKGFLPNPMPYFKNAKLCVVSSRNEGFPNVLLQMMALNDNVVSTMCAGGIDKLPGVITCETHSEPQLYEAILKGLNIKKPSNQRALINEELNKRKVSSFIDEIFSFLPNHKI